MICLCTLPFQVLSKALEMWGLQAISLDNPDMRDAAKDPQNETAFICNLQVGKQQIIL